MAYEQRGTTRKALQAECQMPAVMNHHRLQIYFNASRQKVQMGESYLADGDLERAYITLKQFLYLTLRGIRKHSRYQAKTYAKERAWLDRELPRIFKLAEEIAEKLDDQDEERARREAEACEASEARIGERATGDEDHGWWDDMPEAPSGPIIFGGDAGTSSSHGHPTNETTHAQYPVSHLAPMPMMMPVHHPWESYAPVYPSAPPMSGDSQWGSLTQQQQQWPESAAELDIAHAHPLAWPQRRPEGASFEPGGPTDSEKLHGRMAAAGISAAGMLEAAFGKIRLENEKEEDEGPKYPQVEAPQSVKDKLAAAEKERGRIPAGNREVVLSDRLILEFDKIAKPNTQRLPDGIETCGIIAGHLKRNVLEMTTLIIPKQKGTSDSCATTDETELFNYMLKNKLITIGWIHTHPKQSCFMSSIDVHTHCGYQLMLPEAVAVVYAPSDTQRRVGVFRLTEPGGMKLIQECKLTGFHVHPESVRIYEDAKFNWSRTSPMNIVDLR